MVNFTPFPFTINKMISISISFNGKETVSISVQSHLHRWCIVHKQPKIRNYHSQMYSAELEINDTTESTTSASYLDLLLSIGRDGQLHNSIYNKRDDFNFHIRNCLFLSSNIPFSLNLYDTPGLDPRMNVLFWGPSDFSVSYPNRDTSWTAWNRHSGSFRSIRRSYSAIWSLHLTNVK